MFLTRPSQKFLINLVFKSIKSKHEKLLSSLSSNQQQQRSTLISLLKLIAFFSKINANNVTSFVKRKLVSQIIQKLVLEINNNSSSSSSSSFYLHPCIQLCRSSKHGFGVNLLENSPNIEAGEILVQEFPMILETSSKTSSLLVQTAFTTLAPFQDSSSVELLNFEEGKNRKIIIDSNVMKFKNVDFSIQGDYDDDDDEDDGGGGEEETTSSTNRGIFFFSSRFNHNCKPNAICTFDFIGSKTSSTNENEEESNEKTCQLTIVALRTIHPGEEIYISYSNPLSSRQDKFERMGFQTPSDCEVCNSVDPSSCSIDFLNYIRNETNQLLTNASKYINEENQPKKAVKYLLGYLKRTTNFKKLPDPCHYMRFELYQEILAAAVGVSTLSSTDIEELITDVCKPLIDGSRKVLPENWPLLSGFEVHLAYLIALRMRYYFHHGDDANKADTATLISFVDWWKKKDVESFDEARELVENAKKKHELIFGRRRWKSFEERFATELDCILGE